MSGLSSPWGPVPSPGFDSGTPCHLRIIHPEILYSEWWQTAYCRNQEGGPYWPRFTRLKQRDFESVSHAFTLCLRHHACRNTSVLGGKHADVFGLGLEGDLGGWVKVDALAAAAEASQGRRSPFWRHLTKYAAKAGGLTNPLLVAEAIRHGWKTVLSFPRSSPVYRMRHKRLLNTCLRQGS